MSIVDDILNKISDILLTLQKMTNIWVFPVTEDVRQEDVASLLPPEKGLPVKKVYARASRSQIVVSVYYPVRDSYVHLSTVFIVKFMRISWFME